MVELLPRLTATWALSGRPPTNGSPLKRNSRAPWTARPSCTLVRVPCVRQCRAWFQDPSGIRGATPSRAQPHSTSSEQSKMSGSGSLEGASCPNT